MTFKTVFVLVTFPIALLASGPIVQLFAHGNPFGTLAWAQDATDADQGDSVPSEPAVAPPNVQGTWAGSIDDANLGMIDIALDIFQNQNKLNGTFRTSVNAHGTFKGKIASDEMTTTLTLKQYHHNCKVITVGKLVDPIDINGTYTSKHCSNLSSGRFSVTKSM